MLYHLSYARIRKGFNLERATRFELATLTMLYQLSYARNN